MPSTSDQQFSKKDWRGALWRVVRVLTLRARLLAGVFLRNLRLTHALPGAWRERYRRARRDLWGNEAVFLPSRQWKVIELFYRLILRGWGMAGFKKTLGRFMTTYEPNNPWIFEAVHHLYCSSLKARDVWSLLDKLEEPELGSGNFILYRGKRVSLDLLQSIDELYRMRETMGFDQNDRVVFCELGAGYGRLTDVVLSAMPNATYLIFDLPESLITSQYYLTTLHPDWKAAFYPESDAVFPSREKIAEHRLVFGLPHQLRALPKGCIDAFINIYSFMEMGRAQIEAYFQIIEDLDVGTLYIKQHKHEVNLFDQSINKDDNYPMRPSWEKLYYGTSTLFDHVFETAYRVRATGPSDRPRETIASSPHRIGSRP